MDSIPSITAATPVCVVFSSLFCAQHPAVSVYRNFGTLGNSHRQGDCKFELRARGKFFVGDEVDPTGRDIPDSAVTRLRSLVWNYPYYDGKRQVIATIRTSFSRAERRRSHRW